MSPSSAPTLAQLKALGTYGLSRKTGFLPEDPPVRRLSQPLYQPWEDLAEDLNALMLAGKLRSRVHALDTLPTDQLVTKPDQQRAFLVLTMITHAYVWGKLEPVLDTLPECLSIPLCTLANALGCNPVSCHASVALWNWKPLDPHDSLDLDNLAILHTFSGSTDEAWFYLVTTAIEAKGGLVISAILDALEQTHSPSPSLPALANALDQLKSLIQDITHILVRMYERCDPYIFFWKVRAYLAGWSNMAVAGLPNGLHYAGVDAPGTWRQYSGGSAGQSALIHLLDVALSVVHYRTGTSEGRNSFMDAMREYMPSGHSNYLTDMAKVTNIRSFVSDLEARSTRTNEDLQVIRAYDEAVAALSKFRSEHVRIVTMYIVIPARKGPARGGAPTIQVNQKDDDPSKDLPLSEDSSDPSSTQDKLKSIGGLARHVSGKVVRGTGGTDVIPFLKQMRDETLNTRVVPPSKKL
ncbi:MAG: Indoleamine 2,3-dioxygenase [Piptocephalis tieghemiana]|nr:MAG: Indoleamine 2,3-dioxygenase [Piptocephalis tieghemiana]